MNNVQTISNRQGRFIASVFIAALLLAASPKAYLQNQHSETGRSEDKVVEKGGNFKPPVEITRIKSKAGVIKPGIKFSSDEDWLQVARDDRK
jgi:hypothetical protein